MLLRFLLVLIPLILIGCAQVGTLSGGERDRVAPQLISCQPKMGEKNINPSVIRLQFDEFVQLSNPSESIRLEPADASINATLIKKSLVVSLKGDLNPNTTYSLYVDGGIKDVTEGNDSIYKLVFSTGNVLDSLSQRFRIGDAFTKNAVSGVTVGLYDSDSSMHPRYLSKSNSEGWAMLDYLPASAFFMKAFLDLNKNGLIDGNEPQGQFFDPRIPKNDSLALLLSKPRDIKQMHSFKIIPPGLLTGHFPEEKLSKTLLLNAQALPLQSLGRDSILVDISSIQPGPIQITSQEDTTTIMYTVKEKAAPLKAQINASFVDNVIKINWNAFLQSADVSGIKVMASDSSFLPIKNAEIHKHQLWITLMRQHSGKVTIFLNESALQFTVGKSNEKLKLETNMLGAKDLGNLIINLPKNKYAGWLLFLEKEGKQIAESKISDNSSVNFSLLLPGEYQVVLVNDQNHNGYWDGINLIEKTPAEQVQRYSALPKVRANWEVEFVIE